MKKIKITLIAGLLASGIAHANQCENFRVVINNTSDDNLLVTKIHLKGAEIQPSGIQQINKHSQEIFTISHISDKELYGEMAFHTINIPSKKALIKFELTNGALACLHRNTSPESDFSVSDLRSIGEVKYTLRSKQE